MTDTNRLRCVRFHPYRPNQGPTFTLVTWDTNRSNGMGKSLLRYELRQHEKQGARTITTVLFHGEDFACSPLNAIDSDAAIGGLMGFLTLRPGDTDQEYFDAYTEAQRTFTEQHAESLAAESVTRFPD